MVILAMLQITPKSYGAKCVYESSDLGKITGVGKDFYTAYSDAAEQCYDRRVAQFKKMRRAQVDEERGLAFIDSCANIECQTQKE